MTLNFSPAFARPLVPISYGRLRDPFYVCIHHHRSVVDMKVLLTISLSCNRIYYLSSFFILYFTYLYPGKIKSIPFHPLKAFQDKTMVCPRYQRHKKVSSTSVQSCLPGRRKLFKRDTVYGNGQLKEQAGFLVSRSLTLASTPKLSGRSYMMITIMLKYYETGSL